MGGWQWLGTSKLVHFCSVNVVEAMVTDGHSGNTDFKIRTLIFRDPFKFAIILGYVSGREMVLLHNDVPQIPTSQYI